MTNKKYYLEHRDEILKKARKYYQEHQTEAIIKSRKYYQEHKEKHLETCRHYDETHREERLDYQKIYYLNNKTKVDERRRTERQEHPEKHRARSLALRNIPLGSQCQICGSIKDLERHHPDYFKPLEIMTVCGRHNRLLKTRPQLLKKIVDVPCSKRHQNWYCVHHKLQCSRDEIKEFPDCPRPKIETDKMTELKELIAILEKS